MTATTWTGAEIRELTFDIPFRLPSKKNDHVVIPKLGRVVPGAATVAAEHAIQAIALATIGVCLGLITEDEGRSICAMARLRAARDGTVGEKRLEARIAVLRCRLRSLFADHDVAIEIEERISPKAGGDVARVTVRDLGQPPKRRRSGRKHDLVNIAAVVTDALQGIAYDDDCQVVRELTHRTFIAQA